LNFHNSATETSAVRSLAGVTGDCIVFSLLCKETADASELEILRSTLEAMTKQALQEMPEMPFTQPKVEISVQEGKTHFVVVLEISPDISAIAGGVIESVARKLKAEINFDKDAYAIHLLVDVQASRNILELAQEMAGLPASLAQLAQLFDASESTFRFKSIKHLAENQFIQTELPSPFRETVQSLIAGSGFDAMIGFFMESLFREIDVSEPGTSEQIKPYLALGFNNIASIKSVSAVFGNTSLFTLDVNAPGFLEMCQQHFISGESQQH
jgi:hypothetical protein